MVWGGKAREGPPYPDSSDINASLSGFCPLARMFAPRCLQTPPRDEALALC